MRAGTVLANTTVTGVEMFRKVLDSATVGDNVGLLLADEPNVMRERRPAVVAELGQRGSDVGHQPVDQERPQLDDRRTGLAARDEQRRRGPRCAPGSA